MISIIIPTLNEEKVIGRTLAHLTQNLKKVPHEIIVSDGKSSDRTPEIARRYTDHFLVHRGPKRQTIGQARNLGAEQARGEYLVFMDADVYIPNPDEFFSKALDLFEKKNRLLGLTAALKVSPGEATLGDKLFFGLLNLLHRFSNNILHRGIAAGEFQMVRASAFRKVGGYSETLPASEDYEFFGRLSKAGQTRMEPSLVVFHTGRRAHAVGWPRLLLTWISNALSAMLFRRSVSKEWKPIR